MKTIFLCEEENNIKRVYADETIQRLSGLTELDETTYQKSDLLENPQKFHDTEYIFSTWGMPVMTEQEIADCLPNLKCVFYAAGTVRNFARSFLNQGVKVFSAWTANAVPVAEYTVAQIVLANKGFYRASALASGGSYDLARKEFSFYSGNYGVKIGIIGAGAVGKLVIRALKNYAFDVLVFDPFLPDETAKELGVEKVSLERLFHECNVVSNHLADNEQTKGILGGRLFSAMLPYATFLNTGRGAQVVESDLVKVLKTRPDITAVLDVMTAEPPLPDSEFFELKNCILTPHIAGSSGQEVHRMAEYMLAEFERLLQNRCCKYEVTLEMLERMA